MPSYIDFRYPGIFNLNQTPRLPTSFGPPDMSQQFQSGISALADPLVARMKEQQARADTAKTAADYLTAYKDLYSKGATTDAPTSSPPASARPRTATTGSPAGDDTGGVQGGVASSEVRDTFMNTVKSGGLTNPYGLAAVAATGQAETSWSPGRLTTAWNDLGKPSGGAMSWRAERLQAMRNFTRGADNPAEAQARFFLNEDPALIERLNAARSPEEANALMARAWRYKGYDGGPEFAKREALTKQYAAQLGEAAPAPAPAPTASFAPTVAPAPTPQAAAAVAAPQGPQTAPQSPQTGQTPERAAVLANHDRAVAAALASGDRARADQLSAMRPAIAGGGGGPAAPAAQPAPQQPQQQQDPQAAMQQQVVSGVEQGDQVINDRLQATRQAGQTRVASLDPSAGLAPPRAVPTSRVAPPPDAVPPSPIPIVPPRAALPRPAPAASAPTAPAGPAEPPVGPAGVPTPAPAAAPAPVRVAQATGLPPAISGERRGGIDPRMAEVMLRNARTPEEVNKIGQALMLSLQPPAPSADRFQIIHDAQGNWVRLDRLTGQTTPMPVQGGQQEWEDLSVDAQKGISVQRNRRTGEVRVHGKPTTQIDLGQKGEAKEEEKLGEQRAEAQKQIREQSSKADERVQRIRTVKGLLANVDTGKLAPATMTLSAWGRAVGFSNETLKSFGLDPNKAADAQGAEALIGKFISDQLASGEFPTNNFSNADAAMLRNQQPGIGKEPAANRLLLNALELGNERQKDKQVAWRKWQAEQRKAGVARPDVFDFEDEWRAKLPNVFAKPGETVRPRREIAPGIWYEGQ